MNYTFNVQEPYKTYLLNGKKTIEGRLNRGKYASLEVGDTLSFESGEIFEIKNLTYHESFSEMIGMLGKKSIIPNAKSDEEAINVYYSFYTHDEEKKFGVVAIHLKRIENTKTTK